ncbi:MAG: DUF4197 domain-containing protein [Microscillaceae bacterium]|jgi:hypothetical protein|nr:DUF4197 domain-containing protein [Microscillaceae bacterium]
MKKIGLFLLIPLGIGFLTACAALQNLPISLPGVGTGEPTELEIGSGLKEALNVGINQGVEQLIKSDGYFKNELIKILLPPEAQKVESIMRRYVPGGDKLVDDAVLKMNRAAEDAANEAKPIFVNAITGMTITDAKNILFGGSGAATGYLKDKTLSSLTQTYSPRINNSLNKVGASQAWKALADPYNKFANSPAAALVKDAKPINPDLGAYVTQKALDGLFFKVQEKENDIRQNLNSRTSQLLQRVFGLLDKK